MISSHNSGQPKRSTHKMRRLGAVVGVAALTLSGLAAVTSPANAALSGRGAVDPGTGFPSFYTDSDGLSLGLCQAGPPSCVATTNPLVDEGFYSLVESGPVAGITLRLAFEAAYLDVGADQEIVFARTQFSAPDGGLVADAEYTMTDPYGTSFCTADVEGVIDRNGCRTQTGGDAPLDFDTAVTGRIGPWLTWDTLGTPTGAPPAGFIGDAVTPHKVLGSPDGFNIFRVEGPGITSTCAGGTIPNCEETDLFTVEGQIAEGPAARTDAQSVDFGNTATAVTQSITYTSTGTTAASVSTVTSDNPAFAATADPGCASVAPGTSCTISVTYTPTSGDDLNAALTISDNTGSGRTISVSGSSVPIAAASGGPLAFGSQKVVDGPTVAQTVTVTNNGVQPLSVTQPLVSDNLDFSATGCTTPVAAEGTCDLSVVFDPASAGIQSGTLTVATNGGDEFVEMSGTGTQALLDVPAGVSFGNVARGTQKELVAIVQNLGDSGVVLGIPTITGTSAGDYRLDGTTANGCIAGDTVAAGASCELGVVFSPAGLGSRPAALNVLGDAETEVVTLSGSGVDRTRPVLLSKSPAAGASAVSRTANVTVRFSEAVQGVNRRTVTLTNRVNGRTVRGVVSRVSGNKWRLNPGTTLSSRTRYSVRLVGGTVAIRDMSNNGLRGTSWSFRTR